MPKVSTQVEVGHTGLNIPVMGLGTAGMGNLYIKITQDEADEMVHLAIDQGLKFFDTAPHYGRGIAENRLGLALQGISRDKYVMSSKVGRVVTPDGDQYVDFSRDGILRSIEGTLKRLKIDYVDILHLHDPDQHYHQALTEGFPALAELRSQGVIKAVGAGMNSWEMLVDFAREADFDCFLLAGHYTLLDQDALPEFLPLCRQKGISVFMGGILNTGILATGAVPGARYRYREASPEIMERVARIETVCRRFEVPLNAAATQFPLGHPAVTAVVVGADTKGHIAENRAALEKPIPGEFWQTLRAEGLLDDTVPTPGEALNVEH
jgi:D-threo-aldose 1-dehydrogenase